MIEKAPAADVLGGSAKHAFGFRDKPCAAGESAKDIAADLPPDIWQRLSASMGTKGEHFNDWAYVRTGRS